MVFLALAGVVGKSQNVQLQKIHIIDFSVANDGNKVEINWATAKSMNAHYFEVEKSSDGQQFKTIAIVMGPDPLKAGCDCYWCNDKINTKTKVVYYRLKHININGGAELSGIKMIALK